MLVRHAYRHADDLDSADEGDGVGGGGILGGTRARRGGRQRALETPARKGRDGVSLRVFPALVFLFREGAPLLSDEDDDEDEDSSTPGNEENTATAEEEVMNPWEDARAAEDSLRTPLSPRRKKTQAGDRTRRTREPRG